MDGGTYRLHLTHTGADGDALRLNAEKAVCVMRNGLYLYRNGRSAAQRLHENLILLHIAAQIGAASWGKGFPAVCDTSKTDTTLNIGIRISFSSMMALPSASSTGALVSGSVLISSTFFL